MAKGKAKAKQIKGKIKEKVGGTSGDKRAQAEGRGEHMMGKVQEVAEKAGDRIKKSRGR
jgi:uncharacterized protein YjbJ (UPF0337 family)